MVIREITADKERHWDLLLLADPDIGTVSYTHLWTSWRAAALWMKTGWWCWRTFVPSAAAFASTGCP